MTSSLAMVWACLEQRPGLSGMLQREGVSNSFEMVRGGFPSAVHVAAALTLYSAYAGTFFLATGDIYWVLAQSPRRQAKVSREATTRRKARYAISR